jgi:hypothetical protein
MSSVRDVKSMSPEELRGIRMQLIILMLDGDPQLAERLRIYLK